MRHEVLHSAFQETVDVTGDALSARSPRALAQDVVPDVVRRQRVRGAPDLVGQRRLLAGESE